MIYSRDWAVFTTGIGPCASPTMCRRSHFWKDGQGDARRAMLEMLDVYACTPIAKYGGTLSSPRPPSHASRSPTACMIRWYFRIEVAAMKSGPVRPPLVDCAAKDIAELKIALEAYSDVLATAAR